jgi:ParB/RepB/Spo0J family partition protein
MHIHRAVGTIDDIPLGLIRPFRNQPRKYFDLKGLEELAASIHEEGQITPAWVMPVFDDPVIKYELIAGERRWRACAMAGKPTLRAEIRAPESAVQQYRDSVMENFGRKDCTHLETARAIEEIRRIQFGESSEWGDKVTEKLAKIFVRSTAWINQYRSLLRLHPDVQAMMEPTVPEPQRLAFQVAIALTNLRPEAQLAIASRIVEQGMRHKKALAYVRAEVSEDMRIKKSGRRRRPHAHYDVLRRFLDNLGEGAEGLLGMSHAHFEEMFRHRSVQDLHTIIGILRKRQDQLEELEEVLRRISTFEARSV